MFRSAPTPSVPIAIALCCLVIAAAPTPSGAQEQPIQGEFWLELDPQPILQPIPPSNTPAGRSPNLTDRDQAALQTLLSDTRWTLSGIIYGYNFHWVPPNRQHAVENQLTITPLALIPDQDPRLRITHTTPRNGLLFIGLEYRPDQTQQARIDTWNSRIFPVAQATGRLPVYQATRRSVIETAIMEAVRSHFRQRHFNRPVELRGRVALTAFPRVSVDAGFVRASVRLRLSMEPVRHYIAD